MKSKWIALMWAVLLWSGFTTAAQAKEPLETLKEPVQEVLNILSDPQYQSQEMKETQRQELYAATRKFFDFTELSKRTLARNWRDFSPQQRQKFRDVFSRLVESTYSRQIQGGFKDEKVVFLDQEKISATKAMVKTKIVRRHTEIPVNYMMLRRSDKWRVYDVRIEGVSMVKNYRTQFGKFLIKKTPDDLIEQLGRKLEKIRTQP